LVLQINKRPSCIRRFQKSGCAENQQRHKPDGKVAAENYQAISKTFAMITYVKRETELCAAILPLTAPKHHTRLHQKAEELTAVLP